MYLIVYKTSNGLKARYLTTHVYYSPGQYTSGGWQVLSIGILQGKKFIDIKELRLAHQKDDLQRLKKELFYSTFTKYFNILLKVGLFLFLVKELLYKFFIYIASN